MCGGGVAAFDTESSFDFVVVEFVETEEDVSGMVLAEDEDDCISNPVAESLENLGG